MKPAPFEQTREFQNFSDVMRKLVSVPKSELDEQIKANAAASKGKGKPNTDIPQKFDKQPRG